MLEAVQSETTPLASVSVPPSGPMSNTASVQVLLLQVDVLRGHAVAALEQHLHGRPPRRPVRRHT